MTERDDQVRETGDHPTGGPELSAPSDQYRELVENFPNGLATRFDEDLRYTLAGGTLFDELSIGPEDVEGRTLQEVFPEENVEQLEPLYRAALDGEPGRSEVTFEGRAIRILVRPVRDDSGDVIGGLTLSQDVTELRERERELDAARMRYRTLIEAAPDAIFVADASTGEILEVNAAAEDLLGTSRDRIVGRHQSELHPAEEADRYRELFERHVEREGTFERFDDGSPVEVVTDDGERVPVSISVRTVDLADRTVVYGLFRDDSRRFEYERTLAALHERTMTVLGASNRTEVSQQVVDAVAELLEYPGVAVYEFDENEGVLRPDVWTDELADRDGSPPAFVAGECPGWEAFVDGERRVRDDVGARGTDHDADADARSELVVPLQDYGVLVVTTTDEGSFDDRSIELVEIVAETAVAAFERIDHEESLRQRDNELNQQLRHLERIEDVNVRLREVARILMQGDSRQEIEERLCTHLSESDPFAFAWIGEPDPIDESLVPRAWAGDTSEYLDRIGRSLDQDVAVDELEPAVRTAVTRDPTVVHSVARDVSADSWRNDLVTRGCLSAMSVPLAYDEVFYGVLTIYARESGAFDGMIQSVMRDLSEAVAYAINSVYRKHALSADQVSQFEFDVADAGCFFAQFARETGGPVEFEGMVPEDDGSAVVFAEIADSSKEEVLAFAERSTAVEEPTLVEEGDGWIRLRFRVLESFAGTALADYGISLRSIEADAEGCHMTVTSPPTIDARRVQTVMQVLFPESTMTAKRERVQPDGTRPSLEERYLEDLTDRQRDVVTTAYHSGYFDSPKGASGTELAEEMGISPSAFHDNLRSAERKLLAAVVDSSSGFDA